MTDTFKAASYGDAIHDVYDRWHAQRIDYDVAAATLAELSGGGRALELGIGTGLFAIPLAARSVEVHGIDISPAMLDRLRDKPGGAAVHAVVGDILDMPVAGTFRLIYAPFNMVLGLLDQESQVACFRRAAEKLQPSGRFVVEIDLRGGSGGPPAPVSIAYMDDDEVVLHLIAPRGPGVLGGTNVQLTRDGVRLFPWRMRLASVSELDLMARLAGLELESRWADFAKARFAGGPSHVSVYRRAG